MIIETERLMLRPFTMDDYDIIYRLYSDEEILRYMPNDIMDEEKARKHLERIVSDWDEVPLVSCEMAVILKETQEKIGRTRFHMDMEGDGELRDAARGILQKEGQIHKAWSPELGRRV
jgi:RimJ/RimL family protein N-acetyltransferase